MLKIPIHVDAKMDLWRSGVTVLPQEYVDFHTEAARADLARRDGWNVLCQELVDDGWCDGMRVTQIVVRYDSGETDILRWHESGAWFVHAKEGGDGQTRAYEMLKEENNGDVS